MSGGVLEVVESLGDRVSKQWAAAEFDEALLPDIAHEALGSARLHEHLSRTDIVRWALSTSRLPPQADLEAQFGEPPVTLYAGPRFRIEALFWLDGTTSIHQHGFCGAFCVLEGSSIHSRYSFERRVAVSQRVHVGDVQFVDATLLRPGDGHPIVSGAGLRHALFHLERPSVSIVVRSTGDPASKPQYRYLYPHIAIDTDVVDETAIRYRQLLDMLAALDVADYEAQLRPVLARVDYVTAVLLLERAARHVRDPERLRALVEAMPSRRRELTDALPPVLDHILRADELTAMREAVRTKDGRFMLALLLNVPTRRAIIDVVAGAFPGANPLDLLADWLRGLAVPADGGPSQIGFDVDEVTGLALEHLVRGCTLDAFISGLEATYSAADLDEQRPALAELWRDLKSNRLLRPLVCDESDS